MKRDFRINNKGQVIVITALLVALMLLATVVYVTEVIKQTPTAEASQYDLSRQYEQSLKNTIISALANITNNGSSQALNQDIHKLNELFTSHYYECMLEINYSLPNVTPYKNGLWNSSLQENHAVVGAQASFQLENSKTSIVQDTVSVTSEAYLSGNCLTMNETAKQVTLTLNIINDGAPALAKGLRCYYPNETEVQSPDITEYGNGTYRLVFVTPLSQQSDQPFVTLVVTDLRGIIIRVETTCRNS